MAINYNKWNWWEIPLGVASGGASSLFHLGAQATQNLGDRIGSGVGSALGQANQDIVQGDRDYNSAEAQKDRDWQEYMSSTAVQRQVGDIKAAGLNPWLALNGGSVSGSSTPSGAVASSNSASAQTAMITQTNSALINAITKLASSALSIVAGIAKNS